MSNKGKNMIHKMKLTRDPFYKILGDSKIIESRLFDEKRKKINIGDILEFSLKDKPSIIKVSVEALYRYPSFSDLFEDFPASYFGGNSKKKLLIEIRKFYSEEEENRYGVLGIKFKRM